MKFTTTLLFLIFFSTTVTSQFKKQFLNKDEWELSSKIMLLCFKYSDRSAEITYNMDRLLKLTTKPDENLIRTTIDHYYKTERYDKLKKLLKLASEQNICNLWKEKYSKEVSISIYSPDCENSKPTNFSLSQDLATMFLNDQSCRGFIHQLITDDMKKKGYNVEYDMCLEPNIMHEIDSLNTEKLKAIVNRYGIPEYSNIGFWGMKGVTTIAIHSNDLTFKEKMLNKLNYAKENGNNITGESLAILEDKITDRNTNTCIYGTQGNTIIKNCDQLDSLRMKMGLWTYSDYIKFNGYKNMCSQ